MTPWFATRLGALHHGDAVAWMAGLPGGTARLIVADPPYNIGREPWDTFPSLEIYTAWSREWVAAAHRLLTPDGTLYVCGFPEPLAAVAAAVAPLFTSFRWLVWHYRNKANMGDDWGRSHEALIHLRKGRRMIFNTDEVRVPYNRHTVRYPERVQAPTSRYGGAAGRSRTAPWTPHPRGARPRDVIEVPTLCNGSAEKTDHPTQKPEELIRTLVAASSVPGDLVIDPFGGSGTTYAVCESMGRRWLGCEREERYCRLIADRLASPDRFRARASSESPVRRAARRGRVRDGKAGP